MNPLSVHSIVKNCFNFPCRSLHDHLHESFVKCLPGKFYNQLNKLKGFEITIKTRYQTNNNSYFRVSWLLNCHLSQFPLLETSLTETSLEMTTLTVQWSLSISYQMYPWDQCSRKHSDFQVLELACRIKDFSLLNDLTMKR